MRTISPSMKKILAAALSFAVVLSFFVGIMGSGSTAMAADSATVSLPQIEALGVQGGAFSILEVVPAKGHGSIGYYIDGQEPCQNWTITAGGKNGAAERQAYFNSVFGTGGSLAALGLIGSSTDTPLKYGEPYSEVKPWEDTLGYSEMSLNHYESSTISGTLTAAEDLRGQYQFGAAFSPAESGGWVQMITYLTSRDLPEEAGSTYYYYGMNFKEIAPESNVPDGTLVCVLKESADGADLVGVSATALDGTSISTNLGYIGTKGDDSFPGMSTLQRNFVVEITGVSAQKDAQHPYCAQGTEFRQPYSRPVGNDPEPTWFKAEDISYSYVGTGGDFNFVAGTGSGTVSVKIKYSSVFYKGGFINNEWFYRNVFDWDGPGTTDTKPTIVLSVSSVTPDQLTKEMVEGSSMIVLSSGMSFEPGANSSYKSTDTISAEAAAAISAANAAKKAIVVDNALTGCASESLKNLAVSLKGGNAKNSFVSGNLFFFAADTQRLHLASKYFAVAYDSALYSAAGSAYNEVLKNIQHENFLRETEGIKKLEEKVNTARCIRHIIAGSRTTENKTSVKVLDVEPAYSSALNRGTNLTADKVLGWLGNPNGMTAADINITSISTAELVGKIDDIREKYDLIYIGNNISPYKTQTVNGETFTDYADSNMDGLVYTNIGDTVVSGGESGWSLSGLLDRDFFTGKTFTSAKDKNTYYPLMVGHTTAYNNTTRTFRYSGNDITENVVEQITDFANSGLPVVVADGLTTGISVGNKKFDNSDWTQAKNGHFRYYISSLEWVEYNGYFQVNINHSSDGSTLTARITRIDGGGVITRVKKARFIWNHLAPDGTVTEVFAKDISGVAGVFQDNAVVDAATINVRDLGYSEGMFYCEVIPLEVGASNYDVINSGNIESHSISQLALVTNDANPTRVDNCSHMYELLKGIYGKANVKSTWEVLNKDTLSAAAKAKVLANQTELLDRVNISKPEIAFTTNAQGQKLLYPTPYSMDANGVMTSLAKTDGRDAYYLEYRFKIQRPTDPTPTQTSFTGKLYIDANADGRYADAEWLNDTVFREWDTQLNRPGSVVDYSALKLNVEYVASRRMPADKVGILPWKLEVVKNYSAGNEGSPVARSSVTDYTHIAPAENQAEVIEILQINTSRTTRTWWGGTTAVGGLNLQENISTGGVFGQLFNKIKNDIRVNVTTIKADAVDKDSTWTHTILTVDPATGNETSETKTYTSLSDYLNSFDMLIMGFDDCYQELSATSAKAIVSFIDSGKATLFSHDNSSFFSLPVIDYHTENEGSGWIRDFVYATGNSGTVNDLLNNYSSFGYNFNMAIRNAVGLDRYGIADPQYGISKFAPTGLRGDNWTGTASAVVSEIKNENVSGGWVASGYKNAGAAGLLALENAGYSVAYKANSNKTATVPETQGLTKGALIRYFKNGGTPTNDSYPGTNWYETNQFETIGQVSQVNKGQLTTYPFDINTDAFNAGSAYTGNRIPIATTHFQYQQLNMNTDDVVVWYCLAGGSAGTLNYLPNDVVNDYYIYSKSNVTYTGFGHTTSPVNENEAKLFVNTMIAAYRMSQQDPVVQFTDSKGLYEVDSFFMPSDKGNIIEKTYAATDTVDDSRKIFFTVNDTNIGSSKTMHADFTYAYTGKVDTSGNPTFQGSLPISSAGVSIYESETNKKLDNADNLLSGRTYYIRLDDILRVLKNQDSTVSVTSHFLNGDGPLRLSVQVTSKIGENQFTSKLESIILYKLDLFNLN